MYKDKNIFIKPLIYAIYIPVYVLICELAVLNNLEYLNDKECHGGFFTGEFNITYSLIIAMLFGLLVAIVIKLIFKKKVYITILLITIFVAPIIIFKINNYLFIYGPLQEYLR